MLNTTRQKQLIIETFASRFSVFTKIKHSTGNFYSKHPFILVYRKKQFIIKLIIAIFNKSIRCVRGWLHLTWFAKWGGWQATGVAKGVARGRRGRPVASHPSLPHRPLPPPVESDTGERSCFSPSPAPLRHGAYREQSKPALKLTFPNSRHLS